MTKKYRLYAAFSVFLLLQLSNFRDHGQVFGDSAFDSHVLTSCGLGVRSNITKHIGAVVTLGVPLIKEINNTDVDSTRIHFMVSGQF